MSIPKAASASRMVNVIAVTMKTKPCWDRRVLDGRTATISSSAGTENFLSLRPPPFGRSSLSRRVQVKTLNTGAFKRFAIAVLKLACGIGVVALVLSMAAWGIIALRERTEEAANLPLATLKTWPEVTVTALANTKFRLRTVWRTGNMYYQFEVQGYPPVLHQTREHENQAAFAIGFLDRDGFRLFQHRLALADMSQPTNRCRRSDWRFVMERRRVHQRRLVPESCSLGNWLVWFFPCVSA
jgi:hypothetical protein